MLILRRCGELGSYLHGIRLGSKWTWFLLDSGEKEINEGRRSVLHLRARHIKEINGWAMHHDY